MTAVLELRGATKTFPGVRALDDVSMQVRPNEIVGLIGENGAGKSTLLKVFTGIYHLDEGTLLIGGREERLRSPRDAFDHGIAMVFQEQSVIPTLTVAENIFLGREAEFVRVGLIDKRAMNRAARAELEKVHLKVQPSAKCSTLGFAARQMVEIAKALSLDGRINGDIVILLDEPTSVLERREVELLFKLARELKSRAAIVFISHRLDEILEISDRIYIMRDGAMVHEAARGEADVHALHEHMVGRQLDHEYYREPRQRVAFGGTVMRVTDLAVKGRFEPLSFDLAAGEILGIAGVVGSGREALARCLAGLLPPSSGTVEVEGKPARLASPRGAVAAGLGFIPSERKTEGMVIGLSLTENMTLAASGRFDRAGFLRFKEEREEARRWIERLRIRTPSTATPIQSLSGGNQQKVVLAKWQLVGSKVAILDHPTRGIDVGAKEDVYELVRDMAEQGLGIVLLGDTLEELIGLSSRILVMRDGRVTAEVTAPVGGKPEQIDLIEHMV